ncbi:MAG: transketolase C-terminal domain-containing protein, partial [Elusimicrobiota bacterium]|nr:transketolase C-terminal domain-containing protein [Elusimicrobiota bacterium]
FDISFLTCVPGLTVMAPSTKKEMRDMLYSAVKYRCPVVLRYPRGAPQGHFLRGAPQGHFLRGAPQGHFLRGAADIRGGSDEFEMIEKGKAVEETKGKDLTIMALGSMVGPSMEAAEILKKEGIDAGVTNLRFAKPLDKKLILSASSRTGKVLTVEENVVTGGVGQQIGSIVSASSSDAEVVNLGLPDEFVTYGDADALRKEQGLSAEGIAESARRLAQKIK